MWAGLATAQISASYCSELGKLSAVVESMHFQPRRLDTAFSQQVMHAWLEALDPSRLYFTESEVNALCNRSQVLDLGIDEDLCGFLGSVLEGYQRRLLQTDSLLAVLDQESWVYLDTHQMKLGMEGYVDWAQESLAWQRRWRDFLKYQVLITVVEQTDTAADFAVQEPRLRSRFIRRARCRMDRIRNHPMGFFDFGMSLFLQTYASMQDPHTNYFSPFEMTAFEASMSRETFAFGFELEESASGELEISHLVPGSPAWKSKELSLGDILLEIRFSDSTSEELICVGAEEVSEILNVPAARQAGFVVRKKSGQVRTISLAKEKIAVTENAVDGLLLQGEAHQFGYIYLPTFYTEWESTRAMGCANDVAKELVKLQADGIEGLILDLRFNGGGSMEEALALAGIFIDAGPLCILQDGEGEIRTLKDANRGTLFDGPVVIMVNGFSASASELLAAVLQDYQRVVILGSPTYGKATGQIILPMENNQQQAAAEASGFIKMTVEKFYRVTGKSHQRIGVLPDIVLPGLYDKLWPAEADEPYALAADSVQTKVDFQPLPTPPTSRLASLSAARIANSSRFARIADLNKALQPVFQEGIDVRLAPDAFAADIQYSYGLMAAMDTVEQQPVTAYSVVVPKRYQPVLEVDAFRRELSDSLVRRLGQDVYLEEAYRVLDDWIKLAKP